MANKYEGRRTPKGLPAKYKYYVGSERFPMLNAFSSLSRAKEYAASTGLKIRKRRGV